jgi:phosphoribosylformimino-5-aminoimidazole carboxamide ribotide isomerase
MIIYPAIDLRQGRCIRLRRDGLMIETVYSEDPVEVACHWVSQGAEWLHIVDLDAAISKNSSRVSTLGQPSSIVQRLDNPGASLSRGELPINLRCLKKIRKAVSVPIQFGGGIRTLEDIEVAFTLGANRIILGTVAVTQPEIVLQALKRWGADRIVVAIDAKDGKMAVQASQEIHELDAVDLAHHMKCLGVRRIIYTDLNRTGMCTGVDVQCSSDLGDMTDLMVIVSGGVATLKDIHDLKQHEHYNIEGVIVDEALHNGTLDLAEAVKLGNGHLVRHSAGLIPYRYCAGEPKVLLLWNSFFEQWQFPRGAVEDGEDQLACARREFNLETGLSIVQLYEDLHVTLKYTARIRKYEVNRIVDYYLAEVGPGDAVLGHDNHSEYRWASLDEARMMLIDTSPEQIPALDLAAEHLGAEPGR